MRKRKRFRTEFLGIIEAVDIEKSLFDGMLEGLSISADFPQEIQMYMMNPEYSGWHSDALGKALKDILGPSHWAFMGTLRTMHNTMADLQAILSLKDDRVSF